MNLPTYARAAARLLRGATQPDRSPSDAVRSRSVSTIERALAANRRRARWSRLGAAAAAAAVFVPVVLGAASFMAPSPTAAQLSVASHGSGASVTDSRGTHALTHSVELAAGSHVTTSETGDAVFSSSTGTRLALANQGRVAVESVGQVQRFRLTRGHLDARVAPLKPGERFIIETLDATVEVRGTAFRVTVLAPEHACDGGVRTSVRVTEGVVGVRARGQSLDVRAGGSWPARCDGEPRSELDDSAPPQASVHEELAAQRSAEAERRAEPLRFESAAQRVAAPPRDPPERAGAPATAAAAGANTEPPPRAPLSRQNDAFERAVRARQRGDLDGALELYREFIREFPASPLAQNARVEVMRLLARSNSAAATQAAADYLDRYPAGFAREEAERLRAAP